MPHSYTDWKNLVYSTTYYVTDSGLKYHEDELASGSLRETEELWHEALFENAPQTKVAFIDHTNELFLRRKTTWDHHKAEQFASIMMDHGYITTDPNLSFERQDR